ncbi:MAG: transporter substrate-binding protein, partial [Belnapia sp.]|nr:transporter substrate-binding protein [Belnapia sp.]
MQPTTRRTILLAGGAATLARPARAATILNVVLESEAVILDPYFTTAAITRSFGYHVFDTLFAMDSAGAIRPQMVESFTSTEDGLVWRFLLREGLRFHDGAAVTARDCALSLQRWAPRDAMGRLLLGAGAQFEAADARTLVLRLRESFPLVLEVLGKPNAPVPFILPERLARIPGETRITEIVGSGPFTFRADLWRPGSSMVLEKFAGYVPRAEPADFLAGGKQVKIDQLVLKVMPDQATASTALMAGEIDYQQYVPFDLLPRLERARGITLMGLGGLHMFQGNFRLNHMAPPFDDPAIRRVLWQLVDQPAVMQAIGVPPRYAVDRCGSFWMCDSPYESTAGATAFAFSIEQARTALAATSYAGQPVIMLEVQGSISQTASMLLAQNLKQAGFTVEQQVMDWGTVLARRARKEGWGIFSVYANGIDMISPLTHFYVANSCADYPGWSCDARIPPLLAGFARAPDLAARKRIADEIQTIAYGLTPAV